MKERETVIAAAGGVLFAVVGAIGAFLPGAPPAPDKPIAEITNYYLTKDSKILAAALISAISTIFAILFGWGLWRLLRRSDEPSGWSTLGFGTLLATTGAVQVLNGVGAVPAWESARKLAAPSDGSVRLVYDLQSVGFFMVAALIALLVAAYSVAMVRTKRFPAWLAAIGGLVALANLVAMGGLLSLPLAKVGLFLSFLSLAVWVLITSVLMFTKDAEPAR
jgi:hypothetical protein